MHSLHLFCAGHSQSVLLLSVLQAEPFFFTNKNSNGQFRNFQRRMPEHKPELEKEPHASAVGVVIGVSGLVVLAAVVVVVVVIKRKRRRQSYGPL